MKGKIIFTFLALVLVFHVDAQLELTIGAPLTRDLESRLVKASGKSLDGKAIILEFWSTSCLSCIESFPKIDSLQKKYRDYAQFFLVTNETSLRIQKFFSRPLIKKPAVTFICEDSVFSKAFPHFGVPHVVIVQNDSVKYITYGYNVNDQNLALIRRGMLLNITNKLNDVGFDFTRPLWLAQNDNASDQVKYYSIFMNRTTMRNGAALIYFNDSVRSGCRFINMPLLDLYQFAFGGGIKTPFCYENRIIFSDSISRDLLAPEDPTRLDQWLDSNAYCYEAAVPKSRPDDLFAMMQKDLLLHFPFDVQVVRKKTFCIVITHSADSEKLASKGGKREILKLKDSTVLHNVSVKDLIISLNTYYQKLLPPFIDATGYSERIDMVLHAGISDMIGLQSELKKYGLNMEMKEQELDMLLFQLKGYSGQLYPKTFTVSR